MKFNNKNFSNQNMQKIKKSNFIKGKKISGVLIQPTTITLTFHNSYNKLELIAEAECCSYSWFEKLDEEYDTIIHKELKSIKNSYEVLDLPFSGIDDVDNNQKIVITFMDDSKFEYILRNASNGYYSGYLDIKIINGKEDLFQKMFIFSKINLLSDIVKNIYIISLLFL